MEVAPVLYPDHVEVYFRNTSSMELRLWELSNSWGYWSVSFELRDDQDRSIYSIVRRRDTEFTVNGPTYFILAPGERRGLYFDLGDGWWEQDERISELKDKPLSVRIRYSVNPSPEADEFEVFVGFALSEWVASAPPHNWLFTETPNWEEIAKRLRNRSPFDVLYIFCREMETLARLVEVRAMTLCEDSTTTSMVLNKNETTVGDVARSILEYTGEIRKAIQEKMIYIGTKSSPDAQI